jgi:hypothetical protein
VTRRFPFAFAAAYRLAGLPFGILPATAFAEVSEEALLVRFGPWRLSTPLSNVVGGEQTGGYSFLKTAGPAHLSFSDRGVTFATNGMRGLCIDFAEPVRVLDPTGRLRHPSATLTVADPDALQTALGL